VGLVPAQRTSRDRPAGTVGPKNIKVTKAVCREFLIEKVLPAIRQKWPDRIATVQIQHDNAPVHITKDETRWKEEMERRTRIAFDLIEQAANSPDENVLDLGFFCPSQSLQSRQKPATTTDGLIDNVREAHTDCDEQLLARNWYTHQTVMNEVIQRDGGNNYKIPHVNKAGTLRTHHRLPDHCPVSRVAVGHLRRAGLL